MTQFDVEGARKAGYSDAEIQGAQKALEAGYTPEEIQAHLSGAQPQQAQSGGVMGIIRDLAGGIARAGLNAGPAQFGTMSPGETAEQAPSGVPLSQAAAAIPPAQNRYAGAVGEVAGSPISWMGPGSSLLKGVGAVLSGVGGQAGEDIGGTPGRLIGSVLGGAAAAKAAGAKAAEATIPSRPELKAEYNANYAGARDSGLKLDERGVAAFGHVAQQARYEDGFTGGQYGTAPKTIDVLDQLQSRQGQVSASGLDAVRKRLGKIARETNDGKPTEDAAAATATLQDFRKYLENIPESHVLAGDAEAYVRNTKLGNQNYAAAQQVRDAENRINAATVNYQGGIATRLDNQLKAQFRPILKSEAKQRSLTDEQVDAVDALNKGGFVQRNASQIGRFTPFSPVGLALHGGGAIPAAVATGGASVLPQVLAALATHGARKLGEGLSKAQAQKIVDLAAKRSALYQQRQSMVPNVDTSGNQVQLIRGLLSGMR